MQLTVGPVDVLLRKYLRKFSALVFQYGKNYNLLVCFSVNRYVFKGYSAKCCYKTKFIGNSITRCWMGREKVTVCIYAGFVVILKSGMKLNFSQLLESDKLVLLADGGSTKMEWLLLQGHNIVMRQVVPGVNPLVRGLEPLADAFASLKGKLPLRPDAVGYYGAGCVAGLSDKVALVAGDVFGCDAESGSDLLLASRLLCGDKHGLVCILGTGSCSGLFNDGIMVHQVPSLGYILGDEGGAVSMGKRIAADCLRGYADAAALEQWRSLGYDQNYVIAAVYSGAEAPSAFLGGILKKMAPCYSQSAYLRNVVWDSLSLFFERHVDRYGLEKGVKLFFTGSVAHAFAKELRFFAQQRGFSIESITRQPFEVFPGYEAVCK